MKDGFYDSRAEQMGDFAKEVAAKQTTLKAALRDACFVGACEARDQAIASIRKHLAGYPELVQRLEDDIFSVSVLQLLGYE